MSTVVEADGAANQVPDEMTIFAGTQCAEPAEFSVRGTDLWVLLAEDNHPYGPKYRQTSGHPSREAALEAITAAIDALIVARDRLSLLPALRERL